MPPTGARTTARPADLCPGSRPAAGTAPHRPQPYPKGTEHFLVRQAELAALDAAWAEAGRTHLVELIAPAGVATPGPGGDGQADPGLTACAEVRAQAAEVLQWEEGMADAPLLDIALGLPTRARLFPSDPDRPARRSWPGRGP